MILARLEQADRYLALHPDFAAAIAFLRSGPMVDVPLGRIEIGGAAYAAVSRSPARQRSEARLEAHRKHIDIQYVISGVEEMGWSGAAAANGRTTSTMPRRTSSSLPTRRTATSPCCRASS